MRCEYARDSGWVSYAGLDCPPKLSAPSGQDDCCRDTDEVSGSWAPAHPQTLVERLSNVHRALLMGGLEDQQLPTSSQGIMTLGHMHTRSSAVLPSNGSSHLSLCLHKTEPTDILSYTHLGIFESPNKTPRTCLGSLKIKIAETSLYLCEKYMKWTPTSLLYVPVPTRPPSVLFMSLSVLAMDSTFYMKL